MSSSGVIAPDLPRLGSVEIESFGRAMAVVGELVRGVVEAFRPMFEALRQAVKQVYAFLLELGLLEACGPRRHVFLEPVPAGHDYHRRYVARRRRKRRP